MPSSDFTFLKFLGKGSYGSVYTARRESDGKTYAVKQIDTARMKAAEKEEAFNEVRVIASVYHPNVIGYYEAFYEENRLYIVMECAPHGDLRNEMELRKAKHDPYDEATIWNYTLQILSGLQALHKRNILHRDMKLANVFVGEEGILKIGDLGVAKIMKNRVDLAQTSIGTPYYIAPEVWSSRPYGAKCDMWALGCLVHELCTFAPPFTARDMRGLQTSIMHKQPPPLPARYSADLQKLVTQLLEKDPKHRPSAAQLLQTEAVTARLGMAKTPLDVELQSPPRLAQTIRLGERERERERERGRPLRLVGNRERENRGGGGGGGVGGFGGIGGIGGSKEKRRAVSTGARDSHPVNPANAANIANPINFPSPVYDRRAKWDADAARQMLRQQRLRGVRETEAEAETRTGTGIETDIGRWNGCPASPTLLGQQGAQQRSHSSKAMPSSSSSSSSSSPPPFIRHPGPSAPAQAQAQAQAHIHMQAADHELLRTPTVDAFKRPLPPIPSRDIERDRDRDRDREQMPEIEMDTPTPPAPPPAPPAEGRPVIAGVYCIESQAAAPQGPYPYPYPQQYPQLCHWRKAGQGVPYGNANVNANAQAFHRVPYQDNPQLNRVPHNLVPQPPQAPQGAPVPGRPNPRGCFVRPTRSADEVSSAHPSGHAPNPYMGHGVGIGLGGVGMGLGCGVGEARGGRMRRIPVGRL